jgi:Protein of unknown function (DUF2855)
MKSKVPAQSWRFIVNKSKLGDCKVVDGPSADPVDLADGAILIQVDRISLTANNILYAVLGERLHYWDLFPAPDGFGVIPAWDLEMSTPLGIPRSRSANGSLAASPWALTQRLSLLM